MRITALKASLAAVVASMDGILATAAAADNRDLTAEEQATFDAHAKEAEGLQAKIKTEENLLALKASAAMPVPPMPGVTGTGTGTGTGTVPAAPAEKPEPGAMVGRVALAIAATGGNDQRAMADYSQKAWGDETGQIVANMEQATNTKGGYLVDTAYSRDFISLLRPRVVIRQAGARSVPMPDGNITMRKQTGSTTAGYVGERSPAPVTDLTVSTLSMKAKTLRALVPITNQLIRRSSFGVDTMVRDDLVTSAAIKEDQQFLRGVASDLAPAGLLSMIPAGNKLTMTANPTLATVRSDMAKLKLRVVNANVPLSKCAYIMSPTVQSFLENITDGNGNKAFPEVAEGRFGIYPILVTTSVPNNLGAGGNESEIYFGDFEQFLIGDTYQVTLAASDSAAYDDNGTLRSAFSNDETLIRLIEEHDTQLRYDAAFAVLQGVTWAP
ncbi:phage major capsid protein [Sphingomonas abaci]|uniref:HK97 family phage major capsid protein n=1 Tax=Sphingomonas abaci TaxID=237611 RepID=A0A7W7EYX5_9SPHN|nr:phage major capsid protein [Sphingomonas abaci]MBB4619142.1 HK97 family phage major capsid protein [Sphingomonas abaci]